MPGYNYLSCMVKEESGVRYQVPGARFQKIQVAKY
jgi:hypothetical protein